MFKDIALQSTTDMFQKAGFDVEVTWADTSRINVRSSQSLASLIGHDGQYIASLEHLVRLMVLKRTGGDRMALDFTLDINDYRKERDIKLADLAHASARRVIATGSAESLDPMNSYERKVVHTVLASYQELASQSIGTEPNRRVVIKRISL